MIKNNVLLNVFFYYQEFVESDPILSEFKAEILRYRDIEREIKLLPEKYVIGQRTLQLNTGKVQDVESIGNKVTFGKALHTDWLSLFVYSGFTDNFLAAVLPKIVFISYIVIIRLSLYVNWLYLFLGTILSISQES